MLNTDDFYDSERQLNVQDIEDCELKLGITIPDSIKQLYLISNGGRRSKNIFKVAEQPYEYEISHFLSMKYNEDFKNDPDFLLEGIALEQWNKAKMPKDLLPFALDYSNGFITININTGKIYRYLRLEWDDKLSPLENFDKNTYYLSESLEKFLKDLTYGSENEDENSIEFDEIKPRISTEFYHSEKPINDRDLDDSERLMNAKIPLQLRNFMLEHNGGMPENDAFLDDDGEWVAIHELIPIKYYKESSNNKNRLMPYIAMDLWERKLIPKNFLPFAIDCGGNYFCIDLNNGKIYYYTLDDWSDNLSVTDNQSKSTNYLCDSFNDFISKLVCEEDLEELYDL